MTHIASDSADYESEAILSEALTIAPLAFPECVVVVQEMLRSHPSV